MVYIYDMIYFFHLRQLGCGIQTVFAFPGWLVQSDTALGIPIHAFLPLRACFSSVPTLLQEQGQVMLQLTLFPLNYV